MVVRSRFQNQSGQGVTEAVMLLALGVLLLNLLISGLKNMSYVEALTVSPMQRLQGMVECGVWATCGIKVGQVGLHPSNRVVSYKPSQESSITGNQY